MAFTKVLAFLKEKNKSYAFTYIAILIIFGFWMLFLDSNSWITQRDLNLEIEKLEHQKGQLTKATTEDQYTIEQLEDLDSLERFAREHYGHKKENETLFLIDIKSDDQKE
jgi:cell division protein DivIC|tara:strand:+ start:93 stop:422 length:330 start_codon:yes stop_codon:yes gene_type:complete